MISFYRLNPLSLVQICTPILERFQDKDEALKFVEKIGEKVKSNPEAFALTKVLQGKIQLDCFNNVEKTKVSLSRYIFGVLRRIPYKLLLYDTLHMILLQALIEELEVLINEIDRVGFVHGQFYMLASRFYMKEGIHADYYRASLHFLGCTELNSLAKDDRIDQAFKLSLAALLGKDIFNFGELLAHPILDDLKGTDKVFICF